MRWETEHHPWSGCFLKLQAQESCLCVLCMLLYAFKCLQSLLQVELDSINQDVVPLNFFREEGVEWLISFDWDLQVEIALINFFGDVKDDLKQLVSVEFVDHLIILVALVLVENNLLGLFDHKLVDVGSMEDIGR